MSISQVSDLPDEVLLECLAYLKDPKDAAQMRGVSHRFERLASHLPIWNTLKSSSHEEQIPFSPFHKYLLRKNGSLITQRGLNKLLEKRIQKNVKAAFILSAVLATYPAIALSCKGISYIPMINSYLPKVTFPIFRPLLIITCLFSLIIFADGDTIRGNLIERVKKADNHLADAKLLTTIAAIALVITYSL